jgi:dTDP-D-glucose 4,6-dehydratase
MILVTGSAGFIGSNFSSGITRYRALASTEIWVESFVTQKAIS